MNVRSDNCYSEPDKSGHMVANSSASKCLQGRVFTNSYLRLQLHLSTRKRANSSLIRFLITRYQHDTLLLHIRALILLAPSALALYSIPHKRQPLHRKPHHIALPLPTPRLNLPSNRPLLATHSQRNIPRHAIPRTTPRRSRSPRLANRVRAAERFAGVVSELGDDVGRGAFVGLGIRVGPADECLAAFERVEGQAAAVEGAGAGEGEEGRGDETACCLGDLVGGLWTRGVRLTHCFGDGDCLFAIF